METIKIGTVEIINYETKCVVKDFSSAIVNLAPFHEEMRNLGAVKDKASTEYTVKDISLKRVVSCVNAYFGKGATFSPGQRKWKDKLEEELLNEDCFVKKDKDGIFIVDPHQLSGTINELKKDLADMGITVVKVVNRKRIYIEFPANNTTTTKKSKKKSKKKSVSKKSKYRNNKELRTGEDVKYLGEPFEGFSKFNPRAKFSKNHETDETKVYIVYKSKQVEVNLRDITRV